MKEKLKTLFLSAWSPTEKGLLITDVLLIGILIGWITSPLKNGLLLFSNNKMTTSEDYSTHNFGNDDDYEFDSEEDD